MAKTEERLRRSSSIRLENEKLASANDAATSTPANAASLSTTKDDVPQSAAATTTRGMRSKTTLKNDMQAPTGTKNPKHAHTLEDDALVLDKLATAKKTAPLTPAFISTNNDDTPVSAAATTTPISSAPALENDMRVATLTKNLDQTHTLEDDALLPATAVTNATANTAVAPTTTMTTPLTASDLPTAISRLPRELRDHIYTYVSINEATWIGNPPLTAGKRNVIIENPTMPQPATSIKTKSSIVLASSQTRDEFRTVAWRSLIKSDRKAHLRLYDFDPTPLRRFFATCSPSELEKMQVKGKCHVHIHLTGAFQPVPKVPIMNVMPYIQEAIVAWAQFCRGRRLQAEEYSFDGGADFYDLRLAETGIQHEITDQSAGFRGGEFFKTFDRISVAATEAVDRWVTLPSF
jgi:hypothetical protein